MSKSLRFKKSVVLISLLTVLLFALTNCKKEGPSVINVVSVSIDQPSVRLKVGESVTLNATLKPDNATDKTITWSSSDTEIATVENGIVTARKIGTATITAKAGEMSATCSVTVVATPVTSISLDKTTVSLKVGETVTLNATVSPDDATDKTITWSSSDTEIATVENGIVTARKLGTATITAKAGEMSATCAVTVVATPVASISLDKTTASLDVGETLILNATVSPDDATDKTITWSSSDTEIATVENGIVTARKLGTATITAKAGEMSATCAVTVVPTRVKSISLDMTTVSLDVGETVTLNATVGPDDAADKTITWSSSDTEIATVENGIVTARKFGTATITAKAGDIKSDCIVKVCHNSLEGWGDNETIGVEI